VTLKISKLVQAGGRELQDRVETFHLGSSHVLVVADGAGGMSGGAEAAEYVVRRVRELVSPIMFSPDGMSQLLIRLDREMAAAGSYGETTCVVVAVVEGGIVGTSVGDSGAWLISQSEADNLTAAQCRKPFVGSGRAIPVGFSRGSLRDTLLIASDGLLKYTSVECIVAASQAADLDDATNNLIKLVRYPSGSLPDDISILLARSA